MKQLIHLSENGEIQEATDMQYQCSLNYIYYGLTIRTWKALNATDIQYQCSLNYIYYGLTIRTWKALNATGRKT